MQRLSYKLQLACGELSFGELHLHRGLYGARWKHVHSVRGRQVQGVNRTGSVHGVPGRDIFYCRRGLNKLYLCRLSVKLFQLSSRERSFDELHHLKCRRVASAQLA